MNTRRIEADPSIQNRLPSDVSMGLTVSGAVKTAPHAIADALGIEPAEPGDVEGLILQNLDRLELSRGVAVPVEPVAAEDLRAVIDTASRFAEGTKNLSGPMTFVVMARGNRAALDGCGASPLVWDSLDAWPEHLPWDESCDLEMVGFRIYLSSRIFWEAVGQPGSIERLAGLHLRSAEFMVASDSDSRIDAAFDRSASERAFPAPDLMSLFDAAFDHEVRNVRNLVAHRHPVTWPAVRAVLLALREMRSTG